MRSPDLDLDAESLPRALEALGDVLASRNVRYEVVAVGGSALLLLGLINRATRDLDVLGLVEAGQIIRIDSLPAALQEAAVDVARVFGLGRDWLNPGPAALVDLGLPEGFAARLETRRYAGLAIHLASRRDQIVFKLYAAVDQGPDSKHTADLRALEPSGDELRWAARWVRTHDPSEGFRSELLRALSQFGVDSDGTF